MPKIVSDLGVHLDFRNILEELRVILAYDDGHKKVFPNVPMIAFKKALKCTLSKVAIARFG